MTSFQGILCLLSRTHRAALICNSKYISILSRYFPQRQAIFDDTLNLASRYPALEQISSARRVLREYSWDLGKSILNLGNNLHLKIASEATPIALFCGFTLLFTFRLGLINLMVTKKFLYLKPHASSLPVVLLLTTFRISLRLVQIGTNGVLHHKKKFPPPDDGLFSCACWLAPPRQISGIYFQRASVVPLIHKSWISFIHIIDKYPFSFVPWYLVSIQHAHLSPMTSS